MSLTPISVTIWFILMPIAGVLALCYTLLGIIGTGIFGGRIGSLADVIFLILPLLAFPIFLSIFKSLKLGTILLWSYFFLVWGFSVVISWPRIFFNPLSSVADQMLFAAVLLVQAGFLLGIRRRRTEAAKPA
jgi:hypothetical protein